jgi:hypothetical protein
MSKTCCSLSATYRARSVSSTRSTNSPPRDRAKARLNNDM